MLHFFILYNGNYLCLSPLARACCGCENAVCVLFLPPAAGGTGTNMRQDDYSFIYVRIKYYYVLHIVFTFME